jgi:hypothetical protein
MIVSVRKRLPEALAVWQVYAVIAVLLSGWTITAFLRKLPSWLLTLNLGEILTIFSYSMLTNLVESLIVLFLLLMICIVLPPELLRNDFAVRGTILAIGLIGSLMAALGLLKQFGIGSSIRLLIGPLVVIVLAWVLLFFSTKSRSVHSAVLWISDRLTVFLFILLPLFVTLSVIVVFRNIL